MDERVVQLLTAEAGDMRVGELVGDVIDGYASGHLPGRVTMPAPLGTVPRRKQRITGMVARQVFDWTEERAAMAGMSRSQLVTILALEWLDINPMKDVLQGNERWAKEEDFRTAREHKIRLTLQSRVWTCVRRSSPHISAEEWVRRVIGYWVGEEWRLGAVPCRPFPFARKPKTETRDFYLPTALAAWLADLGARSGGMPRSQLVQWMILRFLSLDQFRDILNAGDQQTRYPELQPPVNTGGELPKMSHCTDMYNETFL